jgi:hypothetical protein
MAAMTKRESKKAHTSILIFLQSLLLLIGCGMVAAAVKETLDVQTDG